MSELTMIDQMNEIVAKASKASSMAERGRIVTKITSWLETANLGTDHKIAVLLLVKEILNDPTSE
jgi:predicted XRE-type DNA-binding protein